MSETVKYSLDMDVSKFISNTKKAVAAFVGLKAAFQFGASALKSFSDGVEGINKLNVALANQGRFSKQASKDLLDFAAAMQKATRFSDDMVVSASSVLAGFGQTTEQIKKTIPVVLDFAQATGVEVPQAASLLGKAFAGNASALARYGVVVDDSKSKTAKFSDVMAQLQGRFGGQAAAATQSFSGQIEQLKNAFGDVEKAAGKFLAVMIDLPGKSSGAIGIIERLAKFIGSDLIIAFTEARARFVEFFAVIIEKFAEMAHTIGDRPIMAKLFGMDAGAMKGVAKDLDNYAAALRNVAAVYRKEGDALAKPGVVPGVVDPKNNRGGVPAAFDANAAKAAEEWVKAAEKARKEWDEFYHVQRMKTREWASDIQALLTSRANEKFGGTAQGAFDQMLRFVSRGMGGSGKLLSEETTNVTKFWSRDPSIQRGLQKTGGQLFDSTDELTKHLNRLSDAASMVGVAFDGVQQIVRAFGGSIRPGSKAGNILSGAEGALMGGLGFAKGMATGDPMAMVSGAIQGLAGAVTLVKGIFGGKSKEQIKLERELEERERKLGTNSAGLGVEERQARLEQLEREQAEKDRIKAAARQMREQGVAGLMSSAPAFFNAKTILTPEDARRQGTLFAAAWGAVVKEKGIVAAADAFSDAFAKMGSDMQKAGIEPPAWFKDIQDSFLMGSGETRVTGKRQKIGKDGKPVFNEDGTPKMIETTEAASGLDETFRQIAESAQHAAEFLKALGEAGGVTTEAFRAFEDEARAAFFGGQNRALELGKTEEQAIKAGFGAANPLLRALVNESVVSGQTLSADIQAMVDQAGIVPDVEFQQLEELRQIRAAVQALSGVGKGPGPAEGTFGTPGGGSADFGGEDRYPGFASGGDVTRTGLALVHQGERVLSADDVAKGGTTINMPVTVVASGNKATDDALVANLMDKMGRMLRKGKGRGFTSALTDDGFRRGAR